jgi:2-iminobutanoate/2-iminopropanoate deaminase
MPIKKGLGPVYHGEKLMLWSKGCVANGFVFLSGVEGRDPETDIPLKGIKAQTWLALDRLRTRLEEAGSSIDNVVKFVFYLANREVKDGFISARDEWFSKYSPKLLQERSYAGTLLIGIGLDHPEMLVEIDAIAAMDRSSS